MSASFESRKNSRAMMITVGFAGGLLLLMFLLSWTTPVLEIFPQEPPMLVELTMPEEEVLPPVHGGGGGGGNTVEAPGTAGAAPYSPPDPGGRNESKDIEENPAEKTATIYKPNNPQSTAKELNEGKSVVNPPPKVEPAPPAPKPKAAVPQGKTLTGDGKGGGAATTYEGRPGGQGTGYGIGKGSGTGGGEGTGAGGGRGSGAGPEVMSGDRSILEAYSFASELDKATIYAHVKVSPDGIGEFIQFAKQTTNPSTAYRNEIVQYLKKMKFNKSDHESMVTVRFNFRVNG